MKEPEFPFWNHELNKFNEVSVSFALLEQVKALLESPELQIPVLDYTLYCLFQK